MGNSCSNNNAAEPFPLILRAARENDARYVRKVLSSRSRKKRHRLLRVEEEGTGRNALHLACLHGSAEVVDVLVERGCDVNSRDSNGDTVLHVLAAKFNYAIWNRLNTLEHLQRDVRNKVGETPLHNAVRCKNNDVITTYLDNGSTVRAKNSEGFSPFHLTAILDHCLEQAETFVGFDKGLVDQRTDNGETPLWLAIKHGRLDLLEYLLDNNADVNATHEVYGTTPLWLATDLQMEEAVELILNAENFDDESIFHLGNGDSSPFLLVLVKKDDKIREWFFARAGPRLQILFGDQIDLGEKLKTCDPNFEDDDGNSLLHLAVMSDSYAVVEKVFTFCEDVEAVNKEGKTAPDLASERGISKIITFLRADDKSIPLHQSRVPHLTKISALSQTCPAFHESDENWFKKRPNKLNDISIEDLESYIIPPINVDWKSKMNQRDPFLARRNLHREDSGDNAETVLVKSVLKVIHDIENYLNEVHEIFKHLGVAFLPVGGVVEGTSIGLLNEMDFMTRFLRLEGLLTIIDERSLVIMAKDGMKLHEKIRSFFDDNWKLDIPKFFISFIEAVHEAVQNLENLPERITVSQNFTPCKYAADSKFVSSVQNQFCSCHGSMQASPPPCVCFTKVGAGLNIVHQDLKTQGESVFTVDLVITLQGQLEGGNDSISSSTRLRQMLVNYLLTDFPPGWNSFLLKYLRSDRANIDQATAPEERQIHVGVKMIDVTGNFVLRPPGLYLDLRSTFKSRNIRKAYRIAKLLKILSNSDVKSYDLKKVMFQMKRDGLDGKQDPYQIVRKVLYHKEMQGKFVGVMESLDEEYLTLDLEDFPKDVNGTKYLHFLHAHTPVLMDSIRSGNESGDLMIDASTFEEEAYTFCGQSPLHWACESPVMPRAEIMRTLLETGGCSVGRKDLDGNTSLHMLMGNEQTTVECLQLLLLLGKDPPMEVCNILGETPLQVRIKYLEEDDNGCDLIRVLIQKLRSSDLGETVTLACSLQKFTYAKLLLTTIEGIDSDMTDENGFTPMHYACSDNQTELARLLPDAAVNKRDNAGCTPLMAAIENGDAELVKILLSRGANINETSNDGASGLQSAAGNGHLTVVTELLNRGTKLDLADDSGRTALYVAVVCGHAEVVRAILEEARRRGATTKDIIEMSDKIMASTPLMMACGSGNREIVLELLENGAAINRLDAEGRTPLQYACCRGRDEIVRILIGRGSHIDVDDKVRRDGGGTGLTALCYACDGGHLPTVDVLLEAGAKIGERCLNYACLKGHLEVVHRLLAAGASVGLAGDDGSTPLHNACLSGRDDLLMVILEKGPDLVRAVNVDGHTPLHVACRTGYVFGVEKLAEKGSSDLDAADEVGWTGLHLACWKGSLEVVKILVDAGARIDARGKKYDETPLWVARRRNHVEICSFIEKSI